MRDDKSPFNHSGSPGSRLVKLEASDGRPHSTQANQNKKKGHLISRNIAVHGHRTSVRLEPDMWAGYSDICRREGLTLHELASRIAEKTAPEQSLTSAIRAFIIVYFKAAATEEGHAKAGHPSHKVGY